MLFLIIIVLIANIFLDSGAIGVLTLSIVASHRWHKVDDTTIRKRRTLDNLMLDYKVSYLRISNLILKSTIFFKFISS